MDFRESLTAEANEKQERLRALLAQRRALDVEIDDAKRYVEKMNPLLELHGLAPIVIEAESEKRGFASAGNRSEDMPPRRDAFENMTLVEAVETLLSTGKPMHARELVNRIYDVSDPKQAWRAKRSLVGTLAAGAREGRWKRPAPNTYQIAQSPGEKPSALFQTGREDGAA